MLIPCFDHYILYYMYLNVTYVSKCHMCLMTMCTKAQSKIQQINKLALGSYSSSSKGNSHKHMWPLIACSLHQPPTHSVGSEWHSWDQIAHPWNGSSVFLLGPGQVDVCLLEAAACNLKFSHISLLVGVKGVRSRCFISQKFPMRLQQMKYETVLR